PQAGILRKQIPCSAEPREECRQRDEVEWRYVHALLRVSSAMNPVSSAGGMRPARRDGPVRRNVCRRKMRCAHVPVKMRQMQVSGAGASQQERQKTEAEADRETDQIKIRPDKRMSHRIRPTSAAA